MLHATVLALLKFNLLSVLLLSLYTPSLSPFLFTPVSSVPDIPWSQLIFATIISTLQKWKWVATQVSASRVTIGCQYFSVFYVRN